MRRGLAVMVIAVLASVMAPVGTASAVTTKNPVIVVAGMAGPGFAYDTLAARLGWDGYRVYIYQLPGLGLGDIHQSAASFATYVDAVRSQTGSAKVDLVAHSEGGLVSRDYVKSFGGATKVDKVITLGSPAYGTSIANIASVFLLGNCIGIIACNQMAQGSTYLNTLNAGDDSIGTVRYWSIATKWDELVQPWRNAYLNAADGNITNVALQDQCWARIVGHAGLIFDGAVYSGVRQALQGSTSIWFNCWAW
jgi:triacylglycerol esterase/lipase EstA (alpha/beta hydrolase family)